MRDLVADQLVGIEVVDRVARGARIVALGARRGGASGRTSARRWRQIEVIELAIGHRDRTVGEVLRDLEHCARRHPRHPEPEPSRQLERAGVGPAQAEQLLQVLLGAIRIARRDDLGELEQLGLGLLLAALRDEDILEPLVRLDVVGVEREHPAQVVDGLLVQAVLHVDVGLGQDLRDLLGVALAGRRRDPRIRRRLHVGREIGVVVLGQREVDAG
jgi:hypothetical protein